MELYRLARSSKPTRAHEAIKGLDTQGQLLRWYTQNIDMLETKTGLSTDLNEEYDLSCIQLHGSLSFLRCTYCSRTFPMEEHEDDFSKVKDLPCPRCMAYSAARDAAGRRRVSVGILLPDIVRTGQEHPEGESIRRIIWQDHTDRPDLLLILGTSLKHEGPKKLARVFARKVRRDGGMVVYVNRTHPHAIWRDLVDYWVNWDCDAWAQDFEERQLALWDEDTIECPTVGSSFNDPIVID